MQNLLTDLKNLFAQEPRFMDGDRLVKQAVIDAAQALDNELLTLLLSHDAIKQHFFQAVGGIMVFDKAKLMRFVTNKAFLEDSYTAFKNEIGLVTKNMDGLYDGFLSKNREVVLSFPYKDCMLEGGQTKEDKDQKRTEVFWNEILAPDDISRLKTPKAFANAKRYDQNGIHENPSALCLTDNFIIKGNNLLALYSLMPIYAGKVKLIYIDPPYNTGNDGFQYNDAFKHSAWLVFMKDRLTAAKQLLRKDGVILIHCDYIEEAYLKVLLDEIFERNNYINTISIRDSHPSGLKLAAKDKTIVKTKSSVIVFSKTKAYTIKPIYQQRYEWDTHFSIFLDINDGKYIKKTLTSYLKEHNIIDDNFKIDKNALQNSTFKAFVFKNKDKIFQSTKEMPDSARTLSLKTPDKVIQYKTGEFAFNGRRLSPLSKSIYNVGFDGYEENAFGKLLCDFWDDIDFNNSQGEGSVGFPAGKKPEILLARLITMFSQSDDLVLDFHLGSGTTAAVAHKMGRQYIGIEQMDYIETIAAARLKSVVTGEQSGISKAVNWQGGGSFVYLELANANERFKAAILAAATDAELMTIWASMQREAFISSKVPMNVIEKHATAYEALTTDNKKRFLIETLDLNLLYVPYCDIDSTDFGVTHADRAVSHAFYNLKKTNNDR